MYKQIKNKYANMLAVILSIAIVFGSFSFPLVPIASAANPLPAPQNVQVTGATHKSITLEWDAVEGVDQDSGYQVWYSNGVWAAWVGNPTATIGGLNSNTTYSFYVTAITAANDRSDVVTAITNDTSYTPPIATLSSSVVSNINAAFPITITFNKEVSGFADVDLVVDNGTASDVKALSATTFTAIITPTTSGQIVTVKVAAGAVTDTAGNNNAVSNTISFMFEKSSSKEFLSFSVEGNHGIIDNGDHTIKVVVPFRSAVYNMLETFTVSEGASVLNHTSEVTCTNYTSPVPLTIVAEDGSTQVYTVTVTIGPSSLKSILSFNLSTPVVTGFIDDEAFAIFLTVPQGTDVTALKPTFTTDKIAPDEIPAKVKVNDVVQVSGTSVQDFTKPLIYTVEALDGSTRNYTVTVSFQRELSTAKEITYFGLASLSSIGIIDETNHKIALTVPFGTNLTSLVPAFTSTGTRVYANGAQQISGEAVIDFTAPVEYVVHDEAGDTQAYTVTVHVAAEEASSTKEMLTFAVAGVKGTVNEAAHTISVVLPTGGSRLKQIATFTTNGQTVKIGNQAQYSGQTVNDYTSPLTYTVIAENGLTQNYMVTVVMANQLITYDLISPVHATGVIDSVQHTITLDVPYGTDLSAAKANFVTTGDHLEINGIVQQLGITESDLRLSPTIHAVDSENSVVPYTLIVNTGLNPAKELTSFKLTSPESIGIVDQTNYTVSITVPYGTNVTQLAPAFTSTGVDVKVGLQDQVSGVTTQDFTNPVTYSVYAADGTKQDHLVTVTVAGRTPDGGGNPSPSPTPSPSPSPTTPTEPMTTSPTPSPSPSPLPASFFKSAVDQARIEAYLKGKVEQAQTGPVSGVFPDVNEHWSKPNIDLFVKLGFITGYQDGTFRPDESITHAELAAIIARVFHIEPAGSSGELKDVKDHWASHAIEALISSGIITGYGDDTFRPNRAISRAEIIAIISRIVDLKAVDKRQTASFNDIAGVWNSGEIQIAASAGIIEGRDEGIFAPNEPLTRAEAVSIILRVLNLNPEIKALLDQL